jgi:hypothetical protein
VIPVTATSKKVIEAKIVEFISQQPIQEALGYLSEVLPGDADVYLVGGAVRNLIIEIFHGCRPSIDDIDLFIGGIPDDLQLIKILPEKDIIATDLGGVRWNPAGSPYDIDICLLKDFIIINKYGLAPEIESLLKSLDFTMNTVVFDINSLKLHERRALKHIKKRLMAFNTHKIYTKTAITYRVLLLKFKTDFSLSEDVFNFVKKEIDFDTLTVVKYIILKRFGKTVTRLILDDYDYLCSFPNFDEYYQNILGATAK